MVTSRRRYHGKRGRPRKEETVTVRIPVSLYDACCRTAIRERRTVAEVIREALKLHVSATEPA